MFVEGLNEWLPTLSQMLYYVQGEKWGWHQTPLQLSWSLHADPHHNESNDSGSKADKVAWKMVNSTYLMLTSSKGPTHINVINPQNSHESWAWDTYAPHTGRNWGPAGLIVLFKQSCQDLNQGLWLWNSWLWEKHYRHTKEEDVISADTLSGKTSQ